MPSNDDPTAILKKTQPSKTQYQGPAPPAGTGYHRYGAVQSLSKTIDLLTPSQSVFFSKNPLLSN